MPGIASLASKLAGKLPDKTKGAFLIELNGEGRPKKVMQFQYFPESISDGKAVNYQTKDIPGGSLPLYQWISSGERLVSFTAVYTSDIDFGVSTLENQTAALGLASRVKAAGVSKRNTDIRSELARLRRYMLPRYAQETTGLTKPPAKLRLALPGSGIGAAGGFSSADTGSSLNDSIICVMTQCEVTYEAFFVSGTPRIATVSLAFAQIPQYGGEVVFPGRNDAMDTYADDGAIAGSESLPSPSDFEY